MKRGTPDHPKLKRLARVANIPIAQAVGHLELLWHACARFAMDGACGKWDDSEIEEFSGWNGEPGALVKALIECGWVDESNTVRLTVHGWPEHCEDSVHISLARKGLLFADGTMPNLSRLTKAERKKVAKLYERLKTHEVRTENAQPCLSLSLSQSHSRSKAAAVLLN